MRRLGLAMVTILVVLPTATVAPAHDDGEGYPEPWPASEQCPAELPGYELGNVFHTDEATFDEDMGIRGFTCGYRPAGGGSIERVIAVDWNVRAGTTREFLCDTSVDRESDAQVIRSSGAHYARVESDFGTSTSDLLSRFLATAETFAAPCPSAAETSSTSSTTTEPEPDPEEPAKGPCVIAGVVTAPDGTPLAGVQVELDGPGQIELAESSTDGDGRYRFDPPAGTDRFAPATDSVDVVVRLRDAAGTWELWHQDAPGGVRTEEFPVARARCKVDVDLGDLDALAGANPAEEDRWPAMAAIVQRLHRASRWLADARRGVGFTMDDGLPIEIYAWCDGSAPVRCPTAKTVIAGEGAPFFDDSGGAGDPHVVIGPINSASVAVAGCEADVVGHEWGHAVTSDLFGGTIPLAEGRAVHGGYFANVSSNDSWIEGFASFIGMQARKHSGGSGATSYGWCAGTPSRLDYEANIRAWGANGLYEEWAVAGLLLDVEDGPADYQRVREPSLVDRGASLLVLPSKGGPVVVGRVLRRAGPDVSVRVDLIAAGEDIGGGEALLDEEGWFYFPVPKGTKAFTSARAYAVRGGWAGADDDPLDATPKQIWDAIATYDETDARGARPVDVTGVFDVADLYAALRATFAGDRDRNGIDDVDQIFRDHGYFADPEGDRTFAPGAAIGRSDRPVGATPATERYDVHLPTSTRVKVDPDATYLVSVTYPPPDHGRGTAYRATPGDDGRIEVAVPPEDSGATVTVLAIREGHLPAVVATIEPAEFWEQSGANGNESFLELDVALEKGDLEGDDASAPPLASGIVTLGLAVTVGLVGRKRRLAVVAAVVLAAAGAGITTLALTGDDDGVGIELAFAEDPELAEPEDDTITTTTEATTTTSAVAEPGDPDRVLSASGWSSSIALADSASASYGAERAADGDRATAWCAEGDATGATITASFAEPTTITVVGLVPGYDKVDPASGRDRWFENRRVVTATWSFDDGTSFTAELTDERDMQYQVLGDPVMTEHVTLTIDRTSGEGDTCTSELELRGHPASEDE